MTDTFRLHPQDTLVLASANQGKITELSELLSPYGIALNSIRAYHSGELAEDGDSFEANAQQKARFATAISGLPALADDSGFCVDALDGAPGIYSARWAGAQKSFSHAMNRIHAELPENAAKDAHFVCVLALCFPDGREICFRGEASGHCVWPPRGIHGFGYDPIFVPAGHHQTFAEMPSEKKHHLSHRAQAFALFRAQVLLQNATDS